VPAPSVVDVDRFGSTAAWTLLTPATDAVRASISSPALGGALWEVSGAAPWSPLFFGGRRRAHLAGPAAAAEAAALCRRRLVAKLDQLALRAAMPPHFRDALWLHVGPQLSLCPGKAGSLQPPAPPAGAAAARAPPRPPPCRRRGAGAAPLARAAVPGGRRQQPRLAAQALPFDDFLPPGERGRSASSPPSAATAAVPRPRGEDGGPIMLHFPHAVVDLLSSVPVLGRRTRARRLPASPALPVAYYAAGPGSPTRPASHTCALVAPPCTPAATRAPGRSGERLRGALSEAASSGGRPPLGCFGIGPVVPCPPATLARPTPVRAARRHGTGGGRSAYWW